jgi:hypothetical protein
MTHSHLHHGPTLEGPDVGKRLDDIGWALFLILTGIIWLLPESQVPPGAWLIGTGTLLLGLNAVRVLVHVPVSGFITVLGALSLAAGLSSMWGVHVPLLAICLILVGVGLIARQVMGRG